MKLSKILIIAFILIAVIGSTTGIYSFYLKSNTILAQEISAHLETAAQSRASYIDHFLEEQKDKIEIAATHSELSFEELKEIRDINSEFDEVFVLDSSGKIIVSSDESQIGKDKSHDDYFVNARDKTYIKDAYVSETTGKYSLAISTPFHEGVLVAIMETTILNEITLDKTGLGETGEVYLINKEGYMITPSRNKANTFLTQKVDSVNARNCLNMIEIGQEYTIDVTFPLHDNEDNPVAVAGITFFYNVGPSEFHQTRFIEIKEKAIRIGENIDSMINSEGQSMNYNYINPLIENIVKENSALKRISIHAKAPEGKSPSGYWILTSSVPEKIGRESDPEDIEAINNNEIIILEEASHISEQEMQHIGHKASLIFLDYRGIEVLGTHSTLKEMQWCLLAKIDEVEALGIQRKELLKTTLIIIITISVIVSLIGYFISKSISSPINKLTDNVDKVSKGDFDVELKQSNIHEIQSLTSSLNRVLASMKLAILRTGAKKEDFGIGTKEALEAKKKAEEKYKVLYDASRDAIMTLAPPSWNFTAGNPATVEMFKTKTEEKFTSLGPGDLSPKKQPDGQLSSEKAKKMIMKAMKEGSNFFDWIHKRYKGESFPATVLLTKVEIEKGKPFLQATVRDISNEKAAQGQVEKRTKELERFAKLSEGRELMMIELKKKIKEFEKKIK